MHLGNADVNIEGPGNRLGTFVSTRDVTLGGNGLQFLNVDVQVTARDGGFAAGEICMFDLFESEGNGAAAALAEVIQPTTAGIIGGGFFGVALAAIADNAVGTVRVQGLVSGLCIAASGSIVAGDRLVVTVAGNLDLIAVVKEKYVAVSRGGLTTPTSAALNPVIFDGINGFGRFAAS